MSNNKLFNKLKSYNYSTIVLILIMITFFSFSIIICHDSAHYLGYIDIMEGNVDLSTWDVVRGPTFPIIIFLSNLFFGKMVQGFLITLFIFFMISFFILKKICSIIFENSKHKKMLTFIILLICLFNPMIFGYYHVMLTECFAITFSIIMCYLSWIWIDIQPKDKKKSIIFLLAFCVLIPVIWFLKQPYLTICFIPVITSAIISLFKYTNKANILYKTISILICIFVLFFAIKVWNNFLASNGVIMDNGRESNDMLNSSILSGANIRLNNNILNKENINEFDYINSDVAKKIENYVNKGGNYYLLNIYNFHNELIDQDIIKLNNDNKTTTFNSLIKQISIFFKHPLTLIKNYGNSYCGISSLCVIATSDGVAYQNTTKFDLINGYENNVIPYRTFTNLDNVFYLPSDWYNRTQYYSQINKPGLFEYLEKVIRIPTNILYKILILIQPIAWIFCVIFEFIDKRKKINKPLLNFSTILLTFSFGHALLMCLMGAFIDRYAIESFIPAFLGIIILIIYLLNNRRLKKIKL